MNSLVVFESMFGNTKAIAVAVAEGLSTLMATQVEEVGVAESSLRPELDLLVVGGPTHAFGLTRPGTRQSAADQAHGELVSRGIGLREWLQVLRADPATTVAAFDTRLYKPRIPGSAAQKATKRLRRLGLSVLAPPESFFVVGTDGPLRDGELDRARSWGERLASSLVSTKREVKQA